MQALVDVLLGLGDLLGRDPRRREQLRQVGAGQQLESARVGDLVHAAAHEQVAGQRAGGRVLDHLIDLELVVAGTGLEEEVVGQVLHEVAGAEDVVAVPGLAVGVLTQRALTAGDEVLRVAPPLHVGERVTRRLAVGLRGSAGEHRVDRGRDELDVPVLLGGDVGHQVVERPRRLPSAEVERLERVVHQRRHLAETPAHQLLDRVGALGIGVGRGRELGAEPIDAKNHVRLLATGCWKDAPATHSGARRIGGGFPILGRG